MKAKKLGFRKYGWMFGRAAVLLIMAVLWATPVAANGQVCGDGIVEAPEECDDGNTSPADGCSAICQFENPFACTGEAFTVRYSPAELFIIDQQASPFTFNPVDLNGPAVGNEAIYAVLDVDGDGDDDPIELNNLGFRSTDGILYAMALVPFIAGNGSLNGNHGIVQIDANGNIFGPLATSGDPIPGIGDFDFRYAAGDVSPDGNTMVINSLLNTSDGAPDRGYAYIVNLTKLVVKAKTKVFGPDVPATLNVADWAYNPIDGMLYGASKDDGHIYMLNPDYSVDDVQITRVTGSALLPTGFDSENAYGGVWFNASGRAFFYRNVGQIWEVDLGSLTIISVQSGGPESIYNDAASCALETTGAPLLNVEKTVTTADGTCPGEDSLGILLGDTVTYCYVVTNSADEGNLYDVMLLDDNGTPGDDSDDFTVTLTGLTDEDGDGNSDDLAAGGAATGEAQVTIDTTGVVTNTATASGFDEGGLERFDSDTAQVYESGKFPFECTGEAFIIQTYEGQLIQVNQSVDPFQFDDIAGGPAGFEINNIGFRKTDGLIYGWKRCGTTSIPDDFECDVTAQQIVTIDANHTVTGLGRGGLPDPVSTDLDDPFEASKMRFFSGDVSPDSSKLYLNWNGGGKIYTVDLPALTVAAEPGITITKLNTDPNCVASPPEPIISTCTTDGTAGPCGRVADWAAHPTNGMLYGGNDTNKKVAILDPATGARRDWGVTCTSGSDCLGTSGNGFGAAWFNAAGNLFLYNNDGTIYEVANVGDCTPSDCDCGGLMEVVSVQENGPSSTFNDGAACLVDEDEEEPIYPLSAEKTAIGSYDRTIEWTLDKSVDAVSHTGFAGAAAGSSTWTVVADKTETLGNFQVTGSITVYNDNEFDVPVTVSDVLSDTTVAAVDCDPQTEGDQASGTVPALGSLTCSYEALPSNFSATLNTATITSGDQEVDGATATATIGWSEGNTYGYDSGTLADPRFEFSETISADKTVTFPEEFTCPTDKLLYDANGKYSFTETNTATLNGNLNLSDTESVTVDCYIPLISKTANGSYDQTHTWDVEKSVDPESQSGFAGDTLDWTWTVNVSETSADSNFRVRGVITLTNPNPDDVMAVVLRDTANGNPPSTIAATPNPATNCNLTADNGATWTLGPGETGTCNYVSSVTWQDLADVPTQNEVRAFLNWGTPEQVAVSYVATPIEWTANVINGTATVGDDQEPDLPQDLTAGDGPWEWTETQSENCSSDPADYGADGTYGSTVYNTATVTGSNGQIDSSDAQTTYDCYAPVVSKDASASYDERHTWDVEKSVDPASQSGDPGDTLQWTWTVDVSESSVDENFSVTGSIDVANPAGSPGNMTVSLVDQLNDGTYATVDCGGEATIVGVAPSVEVAPGATATCSYSASPPGDAATSNTATGTFNGIDFTATADVNFVKSVLNGTADIDDDQEPDLPQNLTAGDGPWRWTETQSEICSSDWTDYGADGTYGATVYNTATVTGSDGQADSSEAQTTYTCEAGTIEVLKYTDGVVNDTYAWSFALYIGPDGFGSTQVGNTSSTLNDGDGVLDFGDPVPALSPDTTYTVCELDVAAGWATEWSIGGVTVIPYNPNAEDTPPEVLGNLCFDVGAGTSYPVEVGQNLRITVDNTFPGGDPRTPGYWKNWSSCSGGGQYAKTTDDVDPDNEFVSLDEVLNSPGVSWGDFIIDSCELAVSILDQRDFSNGRKKSSDAAYTLAMHLLAAQLNFGAGAGTCQEALDVALAAETLLVSINFDATGNYLRPRDSEYQTALDLAASLDAYNNGELCNEGAAIATDDLPTVRIDAPAEGEVIGSVTVKATATDDYSVDQVEFFVGGLSIGVGTPGTEDDWSMTWDTVSVVDGDYTLKATATDDIGQEASDSIVVTVNNVDNPKMHVGGLEAVTASGKAGKWDATVTVTVHNADHGPVLDATVIGEWIGLGAATCTTDKQGRCSITLSDINRKTNSVSFSVDGVSATDYDYEADSNDVLTIIDIAKP